MNGVSRSYVYNEMLQVIVGRLEGEDRDYKPIESDEEREGIKDLFVPAGIKLSSGLVLSREDIFKLQQSVLLPANDTLIALRKIVDENRRLLYILALEVGRTIKKPYAPCASSVRFSAFRNKSIFGDLPKGAGEEGKEKEQCH